MNPIPFKQANKLLSSPGRPHTTELEAFVAGGMTVTCWKPNDHERAMIAAGGPVWLRVMSEGMVPCWIGAECPFLDEPDERRLEAIASGAAHCGNCFYFKGGGRCTHWDAATAAHDHCEQHEAIEPPRPGDADI